jgi:hypothetical protein
MSEGEPPLLESSNATLTTGPVAAFAGLNMIADNNRTAELLIKIASRTTMHSAQSVGDFLVFAMRDSALKENQDVPVWTLLEYRPFQGSTP